MKAVIYAAPTSEPVSLSELKMQIKYDGGTFADNVDSTQSIAPGSKAIANNYTTHVGASKEVLGYSAIVLLESGTNAATGTVDVKIQESDDDSTWTDWTGGAFTQVTTANDNATYEKAYTGTKRYIRTVAKVLLADCEIGTSIVRNAATSTEDDLLNDLIEAAREDVEHWTRRQIMPATWDYYLDEFPDEDYIVLPFGNLTSVTSVSYKDDDGTETTMTVTTEYLVETNGDQHGRIVLPYGVTWPSFTAYPSNPIKIRYVCGWATAALVPSKIKTAIKMIAADMYQDRGDSVIGRTVVKSQTVERLLASHRLWGNF